MLPNYFLVPRVWSRTVVFCSLEIEHLRCWHRSMLIMHVKQRRKKDKRKNQAPLAGVCGPLSKLSLSLPSLFSLLVDLMFPLYRSLQDAFLCALQHTSANTSIL